jgi:hypothetical protein
VANALSPAREQPARPFTVINPGVLTSSRAWPQASRKMSRYEVRTDTAGPRVDKATRAIDVMALYQPWGLGLGQG